MHTPGTRRRSKKRRHEKTRHVVEHLIGTAHENLERDRAVVLILARPASRLTRARHAAASAAAGPQRATATAPRGTPRAAPRRPPAARRRAAAAPGRSADLSALTFCRPLPTPRFPLAAARRACYVHGTVSQQRSLQVTLDEEIIAFVVHLQLQGQRWLRRLARTSDPNRPPRTDSRRTVSRMVKLPKLPVPQEVTPLRIARAPACLAAPRVTHTQHHEKWQGCRGGDGLERILLAFMAW